MTTTAPHTPRPAWRPPSHVTALVVSLGPRDNRSLASVPWGWGAIQIGTRPHTGLVDYPSPRVCAWCPPELFPDTADDEPAGVYVYPGEQPDTWVRLCEHHARAHALGIDGLAVTPEEPDDEPTTEHHPTDDLEGLFA
ncbi:MAG: hypothetical protein R2695_04045 [Acidimicrobiales bacterium]